MQDNTLQLKGFIVWGVCALFFLYEFFLRTVMGTYQAAIMQDLHLTSFEFSILSTTIFLLIYGIMQIPVGIVVDNIGLKKSLMIGAMFCSLSSIGFAYVDSFMMALLCRFFMGLGASFGFVCLLVSVHDWMPHKHLAIFIGLSQFIGTLGPMIATGPLETFAQASATDWRYTFFLLGMIGLLQVVLIALFVENNSKTTGPYIILSKPEKFLPSITRLFSRAQPWYIAIVSTSLYFTIEYLSENEGRAFLELQGISASSAAYMLTTAWIGYAVGCPLLGVVSDVLERRKNLLTACSGLALSSMAAILYLPGTSHFHLSFFILGISAAGQSIGFATIAEQFKKQFVAVGFGFNNMCITVFSALNAPVIGLLLDQASAGNPVSLENYLDVFSLLIVMAVLAVVVAAVFVKETFCKSSVDFTVLKKHNEQIVAY